MSLRVQPKQSFLDKIASSDALLAMTESDNFMAEQNQQSIPNGASGQQIQVKISDEVLKGVYSNKAQIGHTSEEFVMDFMSIMPPAGIVNARVIVSPSHFKRLLAAMQDNLKKYEDQYGTISLAV